MQYIKFFFVFLLVPTLSLPYKPGKFLIFYLTLYHLLQVLLDGPGILKYSDFGLSKVEGENLEDLFQKFADAGETFEATLDEYKKTRTSGICMYINLLITLYTPCKLCLWWVYCFHVVRACVRPCVHPSVRP